MSRLLELSDGSISQTGDGVMYFSDIDSEVKNSLHHSIGISDSTAEEGLVAQNEEYRKLIDELQTQLEKTA